MIYAKTKIENNDVIAFSDGSIEFYKKGSRLRTFGSSMSRGYRRVYIGGKAHTVHRIIAKAFGIKITDGLQVDHIDGNKINNRIENLRSATIIENARGSRKFKRGKTSKYRGVWKDRNGTNNQWRAGIRADGKNKKLGSFMCEIDAARAYDSAARDHGFPLEALNFREPANKNK